MSPASNTAGKRPIRRDVVDADVGGIATSLFSRRPDSSSPLERNHRRTQAGFDGLDAEVPPGSRKSELEDLVLR